MVGSYNYSIVTKRRSASSSLLQIKFEKPPLPHCIHQKQRASSSRRCRMQSLPLKSQRVQNPATMALENPARECGPASLRKKTALPDASDDKRRKKCSYNLSAIFHAVTSPNASGGSFDFPSIEWSNDDEDDCRTLRVLGDNEACLPLSPTCFLQDHSPNKRRKSSHSCHEPNTSLVRCCAIARDLCSLGEYFPRPTPTCTPQSIRKTTTSVSWINLLDQLNDDFDRTCYEISFPVSRRKLQQSEE